jgi:hypothetical protein
VVNRLAAAVTAGLVGLSSVACSSRVATRTVTPSPDATASAAVSPPLAASPTAPVTAQPTTSPSSTGGAIACRIPIDIGGDGGDFGYFLSNPTAEATKPVLIGSIVDGLLHTEDTPVLVGSGFTFTYDRAVNRWIPAPWAAVSPDGHRYAYAVAASSGSGQDVHIVDIASGADRMVARNGLFSPLQFDSATLYLDDAASGTPGTTGGMLRGSGLYALDLASSTVRRLFPSGSSTHERWDYIIGGYAYGSDLNPNDLHPAGFGEATDELVRLDLASGAVIRFQYHPGSFVDIAGVAPDGRLIVSTDGQGLQILASAGSNPVRIAGAPLDAGVWFSGPSQTWLVGHNDFRIFELMPNGTARYVMTMTGPTTPQPNGWWQWAGSCG